MYAIAINGSPRKGGNTEHLLNEVLAPLKDAGWETEVIRIGGTGLRGCTACSGCFKSKDNKCVLKEDEFNGIFEKFLKADALILGSPTYFADVTAEMKALIDRTGYVARGGGSLFSRKIGAALAVARRAGTMNVYQTINNFFLINDMIVPGSSYWNVSLSRDPGDYAEDAEANGVMEHLAENILWLNEKIRG